MMDRSMWKKNLNEYEYHIYYINIDIHKPFKMVIIEYDERVHDMFELDRLLPPHSRNKEE